MRPSSEFAKELFNNTLITVVEIGVYTGSNAKDMLDNMNIKTLYLIDPYELNEGYDKEIEDLNVYKPLKAKQIAKELLLPYKNVKWVYKKSEDATEDVIKNIDYVYIDGDHRCDSLRKDIELYYPLVRSGGILSGHDYHQQFRPDIFDYVTIAVDRFGSAYNYTIQNKDLDWWIIKR